MSYNPVGLHGLLQGELYLYTRTRAEQQALALLRHKKTNWYL
jgi:hypothetical protein